MKIPRISIIALISFLALAESNTAQVRLEDSKTLLLQGRIREAVGQLDALLDEPGGRTPEVFYYLGFALCELPDRTAGKAWLQHGKRVAPEEWSRYFDAVLSECSAPAALVSLPARPTRSNSQPGVRSNSKGGYYFGDDLPPVQGSDESLAVRATLNLVRTSTEELQGRIFPPSRRDDAVQAVKNLLRNARLTSYSVQAVGPFVFVSRARYPQWQKRDFERLQQNLDQVMKFYETTYDMLAPEQLITIYLTQEEDELVALARAIHRMDASPDVIGYSVDGDMSVVAVIRNPDSFGTISHELLHLMVHRNFADIPNWLQEVMASAFAVASLDGNKLKPSLSNWRAAVLQRFRRSSTVDTRDIVNLTWKDLDGGNDRDRRMRAAVNHALICYFVLYLDDQGKLLDVYTAYRRRKKPEDLTDETMPLTKSLSEPLTEINARFQTFLEKNVFCPRCGLR